MTDDRKKMRLLFLISAALVATTIIAYEPIRNNGFVNFDDDQYITENPNVKAGLTLKSIEWSFTQSYASNWHPLTWLSHILDFQLFGLNPLGHHLINVLIHIVNSLLLFWILTNITGAIWPSAFVAAVFALHPLQVESVAWAAERKTVLSGLFWFLTMAVYIWYTKRPGIGRYILLFLVYGLCVMTKPSVVTLPFVFLLLDYWPLERVNIIGGVNPALQGKRLLAEKVPLLILSVVLCAVTLIAQHTGGAIIALEKVPFKYRIANAFISYTAYIGKFIWPSKLAVFYPFPTSYFPMTKAVICGILFILITGLVFYAGRRKRYLLTGWLWYAGTMVPMAGLVQAGSQTMADRYMYISMLGLLIIAAWAVKDIISNRPVLRVVAIIIAAMAITSAVILTRTQVKYWQNSKTLFEHTLSVTKNNAPAEFNYGCALISERHFKEAIEHMNKAVRICPSSPDALKGLGIAFLKDEKSDEAAECFKEILKRGKGSAEVNYYLAVASGMQKKYDDAIKYLTAVLEQDPNYPDAHNKMGAALLATGKTTEAIEYLNEELKISGDDADVYVNFGKAYGQSGRNDLVIQNWSKAIELKPDRVDILNNLAWLLATRDEVSAQDINKAVEYAERACKLTGYKEAIPIDTLAACYAAAGRFDKAITTANEALNAAKTNGQTGLANEIQERIKLYQSGVRYRQDK